MRCPKSNVVVADNLSATYSQIKNMTRHIQLSIDGIEYDVEPKVLPRDCWQTPASIIALIKEVFGGDIATDPCTAPDNPTNAKVFFTPQDGGLRRQWKDNAFVNPPYSDPSEWLGEIPRQIQMGNIKEAIALVPTGCLGTERSGPFAETANGLCLWRGRIHFIDPITKKPATQTSFTSAFLYWGENVDSFIKTFKPHGMTTVKSLPYAQRLDILKEN